MVDPAARPAGRTPTRSARRPSPMPAPVPPDGVAADRATPTTATLRRRPRRAGDCPQCAVARERADAGRARRAPDGPGTGDCAAHARAIPPAGRTACPPTCRSIPTRASSRRRAPTANGCALRVVSFAIAAPIARTARLVLHPRRTRRLSRRAPGRRRRARAGRHRAATAAPMSLFAAARARAAAPTSTCWSTPDA